MAILGLSDTESGNVILTRDNEMGYKVFILERDFKGVPLNILYMSKGEIKRQKYSENIRNPIPFMRLDYRSIDGFIPDLLDVLIKSGVRPRTQIMGKEEKKAVEKHLDDMRKIVSKQLDVQL